MTRSTGILLTLGITLFAANSCAHHPRTTTADATATPDVSLTGTLWRIEALGPETSLVAATTTELRIGADGRVSGNTGCNRFSGSATMDGSAISFSPLASTRRGCEEALMAQETAMLNALQAT